MTSDPHFQKRFSLETAGLGQLEIEISDDFAKLKPEWLELEAEGISSLYQRYDWVSEWTKKVAGPARTSPRLVIGRQGDVPMFILPMGLRKRGPFNVASWLGDSHSNFHMGLFAKAFIQNARPQDVRDLMDCVTRNLGRVDVLEMCCQPVVWQGFTNPFTFLDWQESHNHGFALDLREGFDAAINRKNGSRKRKKHRWQRNKTHGHHSCANNTGRCCEQGSNEYHSDRQSSGKRTKQLCHGSQQVFGDVGSLQCNPHKHKQRDSQQSFDVPAEGARKPVYPVSGRGA